MGLSALAAALTINVVLPVAPSMATLVSCLVPAIVVYWVVNSAILGAAMSAGGSRAFVSTFLELIKSETEMLVFAFAGGLCGLVMLEVSTWIGLVALVVVLIAADLLVISRPRPATVRMRHPGLGAAITQIGALSLAAGGSFVLAAPVGSFAAAAIGAIAASLLTFIVILVFYRRRMDAWHPRIAIGVVWADAPATAISAIVGSVAASASLVIGGAVAAGAGAATIAVAHWRRRRRAADDEDDALALALVELALLDRPQGSTPAS